MGRKFPRRHGSKPCEELRLAFEKDAAVILRDPDQAAAIASMILEMNAAMRHLFKCSALRESLARAGEYIIEVNCQQPLVGWEQAIAETITPFVFLKVAERSRQPVETVRQRYHQYLMRATV